MSSFEIDVEFDTGLDVPLVGLDVGEAALITRLKAAVLATLLQEQVQPPAMLTLLLTNDRRLQQLNRDFRGVDEPTDVLSFPAGDSLPKGAEPMPYLGDIAVSVPYAARQATAGGHSLVAELQLLAVHGVLHLLGYDHAEPEEKERMWAAQSAVLNQLDLEGIVPTEK